MSEVKHLDRAGIKALLPHRGPALMLDSAEVGEDSAISFFKVTMEVCEGHLPNQPILRGVDRIEIIGLTLGLIVATNISGGKTAFLTVVNGIKFRGQATVEDVVRAEVKVNHLSQRGVKGTGELFVGDREICSIAELTGVIGEIKV